MINLERQQFNHSSQINISLKSAPNFSIFYLFTFTTACYT